MHALLALLLSFAPTAASVPAPSDSAVVPMMPVITVTAARIRHVDLDVAPSVGIVDARQMRERDVSGVAEALEGEAGVMNQRTGNGMDSPFIRGLTGKEILILVDGMRVNNSTFRYGPNQYLNLVDEGMAERIELVRGPGSVLYGSDALGGVINILGRAAMPDTPLRAELETRVGSADGESGIRGLARGRSGRVGYELGGAYKDFKDLEGGGDIGTQLNTGYTEDALHARLDLDVAPRWRASARFQRNQLHDLQRTDRFPGESYVFNPERRTAFDLRMSLLPEQTPSRGWLQEGLAAFNFQRQEEGYRRQAAGSLSVKHYRNDVDGFGGALQLGGRVGTRTRQAVGAEVYADAVDSWRVDETLDADGAILSRTEKDGDFPDDASYRSMGVYAQNEWRVHPRLDLTTGARWWATHAEATLPVAQFGHFTSDKNALTGAAALGFHVDPRTRLYVGVSNGFRAPNLDDLAVLRVTNTGVDIPSPKLDAEKLLNYELGVKHRGSRLRAELYAFYADFYDLIARVPGVYEGSTVDPDSIPYEAKVNLNDAHIWGVEFAQQWSPLRRLQLRCSGHYLWGQNESDDEPLRRIPPPQLRLGVRYALGWKASWVDVEGVLTRRQDRLASGDISDSRIPPGGTPGYQLLNLRAGARPHRSIEMFAGLENVLDEAYRVHGSGVDGVGRNAYLSLRLLWD